MTDDQAADTEAIETTEASTGTSEASGQASEEAKPVRQSGTLKGGHDPAEMARRRWAKDRARKSNDEEQAVHEQRGHAVVVRTTVQVGQIVSALAKDAAKGNTQSARELRAYLADFPVETDTDVSALDRRTRQALLAMLLDDRLLAAYDDGRLDAWLASL